MGRRKNEPVIDPEVGRILLNGRVTKLEEKIHTLSEQFVNIQELLGDIGQTLKNKLPEVPEPPTMPKLNTMDTFMSILLPLIANAKLPEPEPAPPNYDPVERVLTIMERLLYFSDKIVAIGRERQADGN